MILCDFFMRVYFMSFWLHMSACDFFFFFFLVGCFGAEKKGSVQKYKNGATNLFTPRVFCDFGILSVGVFLFF